MKRGTTTFKERVVIALIGVTAAALLLVVAGYSIETNADPGKVTANQKEMTYENPESTSESTRYAASGSASGAAGAGGSSAFEGATCLLVRVDSHNSKIPDPVDTDHVVNVPGRTCVDFIMHLIYMVDSGLIEEKDVYYRPTL